MSEETITGVAETLQGGQDGFETRLADMIAEKVAERVIKALGGTDNEAMGLPPPMRTGTCNLTGLRRHQFARFCEIMRANPTESPFRAAKQAIAEFPGRGGYSRASSLQRYAGKHRKCW